MEILVKTAFYAAAAVSGLAITFLFLSNLLDPPEGREAWPHKALSWVAGAVGYGLLVFGFRLAHQQHLWYGGFALAVAALAAAGGLLYVSARLLGKAGSP